eukprot:827973-Pleurochrysis_carterae.AAC.1
MLYVTLCPAQPKVAFLSPTSPHVCCAGGRLLAKGRRRVSSHPSCTEKRRPHRVRLYATSVGSKALTIKQACVLAVIFEFAGSVLAGSAVADTIRKGIADYECYMGGYMDSALLMYGNLCVVASVGIWLAIATFFEMCARLCELTTSCRKAASTPMSTYC